MMWWLALLLLSTLKSALSPWCWPKPNLHTGTRTEVSTHTVLLKPGTISPCWPLAGAVPSPVAPARAVQVAEPLGSCGFQGGPYPGRRRD
uniref:Uncharacterized protein n=1 Tax=Aotus nancymaae TaxID=37293 RepID=A0A2K5DJK2_AOTNA